MGADRTRPWRRTTPAALIILTVADVIAATTLGPPGGAPSAGHSTLDIAEDPSLSLGTEAVSQR
jgi:hypothetical protein